MFIEIFLFYQDDRAVCLADYCPIFRCEVLRNSKFFYRSDRYKKSTPKKVLNEHQLTILRSRCSVRIIHVQSILICSNSLIYFFSL